ncbi:MAG TPA: hypothetical protein VNM14_11510 [Planctomycetota bacterium]|jgi:hypothetical protein|nr:hypothetical protein [Planctomycetota bacterium]
MRFWILLTLAGCASAPVADEFRERRLAGVPDNAQLHGLAVFSEDGRHVAYVERDDGISRAVCGSWKSRPFNLVC